MYYNVYICHSHCYTLILLRGGTVNKSWHVFNVAAPKLMDTSEMLFVCKESRDEMQSVKVRWVLRIRSASWS